MKRPTLFMGCLVCSLLTQSVLCCVFERVVATQVAPSVDFLFVLRVSTHVWTPLTQLSLGFPFFPSSTWFPWNFMCNHNLLFDGLAGFFSAGILKMFAFLVRIMWRNRYWFAPLAKKKWNSGSAWEWPKRQNITCTIKNKKTKACEVERHIAFCRVIIWIRQNEVSGVWV